MRNQEPECCSIILLLCDLHDFSAAILAKKERGVVIILCDLHDCAAILLMREDYPSVV
jgi:hypothetical protein